MSQPKSRYSCALGNVSYMIVSILKRYMVKDSLFQFIDNLFIR